MTKSEPMKITLLTNLSGEIICAKYRLSTPHKSNNITTEITPSPEQELHEIDIPAGLYQHIVEGTLDSEIFNYRVEGAGEQARLVKGSAK
jgi:hypothetical protein